MSRSRNWCFTLNNFTEGEVKTLKELECNYIIFGKEHIFSKGETPHLQGYIEFKNGITLKSLKKKTCDRIHLEQRKGTAKEASDYCCKEDKVPYKRGTISEQGKRSDLENVAEDVESGMTLEDIAKDNPVTWIKYHKGITSLWNIHNLNHRDEKPKVIWIFGKAGVGKTKYAYEQSKDSVYIKDGTQWWDGYTGQKNVVIDDFDGHWPFRDFLRLLDRYPYQGQIKGGYIKLNSDIWITCEFSPDHFWNDNELKQVKRRIDKIYFCDENGNLTEHD